MQRASMAVLPQIGQRRDSHQVHVSAPSRKGSLVADNTSWSGEQVVNNKKTGLIEVKTSPWQLVSPSGDNQCHFIVCCPTEMFDLPDNLRQEILRLHGTKAGFVIYADNGKNVDRRRRATAFVKSFVFIPYNIQAYETFPLEAEQEIKRYFDPPKYNLSLTAIIRLKTGSLKSTPNGVMAMVGSFQRLKNELAKAEQNTTHQRSALHVLILPLTVRLYDIVDFVTEALSHQQVDTSGHLMKVGPQLITFSELYTTTNTELTHVLISVNMQHDPHAGSGVEGQYYMIDFPGAIGSRYLGETTGDCVSRKLYEETGIHYRLADEDGVMNMLSLDRTMLTVVEELESDVPLTFSTSPSHSLKSGGTASSSMSSLPGIGGASGGNSPAKPATAGGGIRKPPSGINVGGFIFDNSDVLNYTLESVEKLTTGRGSLQPTVLSMEEYNEMCSGVSGEEDLDSWD